MRVNVCISMVGQGGFNVCERVTTVVSMELGGQHEKCAMDKPAIPLAGARQTQAPSCFLLEHFKKGVGPRTLGPGEKKLLAKLYRYTIV